jgi:transposase InsO family protein
MRFIVALKECDETFTALCRRFGISRQNGYKWFRRYEEFGAAGLEDQPPVASHHPAKTPDSIVDAIVAARKLHPTWGPRKLRVWLSERDPRPWPASSTIGDILKTHGLVHPPRRRPRTPPGLGGIERGVAPNDVWCTDFKGDFRLGDRTRCYPLTISDEGSRYLLKCEGLVAPRHELAAPHFEMAFREFGRPDAIRSDNGAPFASTAPGGLSRLSRRWVQLAIDPLRIDPGEPQQNGVHERMHRTLKADATQPPGEDLAAQQRAFDRFRATFNDERPHEALAMKPPAKVYTASRRPMPAVVREPEYADGTVRRCNNSGWVKLRGLHVNLSVVFTNAHVVLREVADGREELRYGPVLLGWVDRTSGETRFERL